MERNRGHREAGDERECQGRDYRQSEEWLAARGGTEVIHPKGVPALLEGLAALQNKGKEVRRFSLTIRKPSYYPPRMTKQPPQKPTASELEILRVLWDRGPSTVREVHEALREKKDLGYTTVLKLLQIMTAKGTVRRNEDQTTHVYEACQHATETKRQLVGDVLQRVFEGSASELMIHALETRRTSKKELDELRRLLDEYEGRNRWPHSRI